MQKSPELLKITSENAQSNVITAVKKAANYIQKNGIEKSIIEFRKGPNDIFLGDYNGTFFVSPLHPEMIVKNQLNFKDPSGVLVVQEEIAKAKVVVAGPTINRLWEGYRQAVRTSPICLFSFDTSVMIGSIIILMK